jgi:hypothetical protein
MGWPHEQSCSTQPERYCSYYGAKGPPGREPAGCGACSFLIGSTLKTFIVGAINSYTLHGQVPPTTGLATRFLSRYDKSATNIKESEIFITIGQVSDGASGVFHLFSLR